MMTNHDGGLTMKSGGVGNNSAGFCISEGIKSDGPSGPSPRSGRVGCNQRIKAKKIRNQSVYLIARPRTIFRTSGETMKAMIEINKNIQRQPIISWIILTGSEILGDDTLNSPSITSKIPAMGIERPGNSSSPDSPAAKSIVAITAKAKSDNVQSFLRVILVLLDNVCMIVLRDAWVS